MTGVKNIFVDNDLIKIETFYTINFSIVSETCKEVYFKIRYNTILNKVFETYKDLHALSHFIFYYNDQLILSNDSPCSLKMSNGCRLRAVYQS